MKTSFGVRHGMVSLLVLAGVAVAAHRATADAPVGRYTIQNGTVLDTKTGLTWQQAVPSQTYTWDNAKTYCSNNTAGLPGSGWRLPSMTELQTIVDDSRNNPAIDPAAFPSTPSSVFWTSSPWSGSSGSAWVVGFGYGLSDYYAVSNTYRVRCVR